MSRPTRWVSRCRASGRWPEASRSGRRPGPPVRGTHRRARPRWRARWRATGVGARGRLRATAAPSDEGGGVGDPAAPRRARSPTFSSVPASRPKPATGWNCAGPVRRGRRRTPGRDRARGSAVLTSGPSCERHQQRREGELDRGAVHVTGDAAETAHRAAYEQRRRRDRPGRRRPARATRRTPPSRRPGRRPAAVSSQDTSAASGETVPECGWPRPSVRAAGTPRTQVIGRARPARRTDEHPGQDGAAPGREQRGEGGGLDPGHHDGGDDARRAGRAGLHHRQRPFGVVRRGQAVGGVGEPVPVDRATARREGTDGEDADGEQVQPGSFTDPADEPDQEPERQYRERERAAWPVRP